MHLDKCIALVLMLQRVSSIVDSISNKVLHSLLDRDQRSRFPSLHGLIAFNGCLSLPFITAFHHCLAMFVDKGGVIV